MEREEFGKLWLGPAVTASAVTLHCTEYSHGARDTAFLCPLTVYLFSYEGLDRNPEFSKFL